MSTYPEATGDIIHAKANLSQHFEIDVPAPLYKPIPMNASYYYLRTGNRHHRNTEEDPYSPIDRIIRLMKK